MWFEKASDRGEEPPTSEDETAEANERPDAAIRDELGLHQRWYFVMRLAEELERASRRNRCLSVVAWEYRLLPGETVPPTFVRRAAEELAERVRAYDVVFHLDDCRFVALLPDADGTEARTAAFRIKADLCVAMPGPGKWRAGVAAFPADGLDADTLVYTALERLEEDVAR
ncbi:MAG TPA: hypothetical protein VNM43_01605 [Dehalococcoidia bacterium]|nr:hypothetical protein [Dehalococcoidia bacterium]